MILDAKKDEEKLLVEARFWSTDVGRIMIDVGTEGSAVALAEGRCRLQIGRASAIGRGRCRGERVESESSLSIMADIVLVATRLGSRLG